MTIFKINGERNSGTNFLEELFKKNHLKTYVDERKNNIIYHWKHGIPHNSVKKIGYKDNKIERVVDIFIFRKLNSWLVSMFYNPYELKRIDNFHDFLTMPQQILPSEMLDFRTMKIFNADDEGKTIFDIRYYKYYNIMEYKKINRYVVLVSLEYIQDEKNCNTFLNELKKKYYLENERFVTYVRTHSKSYKREKNTKYEINPEDYKNIIDKYKNLAVENHINNLKFEF